MKSLGSRLSLFLRYFLRGETISGIFSYAKTPWSIVTQLGLQLIRQLQICQINLREAGILTPIKNTFNISLYKEYLAVIYIKHRVSPSDCQNLCLPWAVQHLCIHPLYRWRVRRYTCAPPWRQVWCRWSFSAGYFRPVLHKWFVVE